MSKKPYDAYLPDGRGIYAYGAERLARGATSGSGTDKCARCKKAKEKTRLNYMFCQPCDDLKKRERLLPPPTRYSGQGPSVRRRTRIVR